MWLASGSGLHGRFVQEPGGELRAKSAEREKTQKSRSLYDLFSR